MIQLRKSVFRRQFSNIGLILGSIIFTLILAELLIRLFIPQQLPTIRKDIWIPKEGVGVEKAANIDTVINSGEGVVRFITDEDGYRVGATPVPDDAPRVLVVGDSFIEATAVEYEDSISGLMESMLMETCGTPVRIVSAGVGGWGPNHYLYKTRLELEHRKHELVVVFIYLGNDIVDRKTGPRRPKGRSITPFRMPESFEYQEIVNALVYPLYVRLKHQSHLVVLAKSNVNSLLMRIGLARKTFPATLIRSQAESELWDVTAELTADIAAVAEVHDVPIIFVILPADYQVDEQLGNSFARGSSIDTNSIDLDQSNRILSQKMSGYGLQVIDTTVDLRLAFQGGQKPYAAFDRHLSTSGHEVVVNRIFSTVDRLLRINNCN